MKRKLVNCLVFSFEKAVMQTVDDLGLVALGMILILTPSYSNDHLSNQNLSETTQSLARFFQKIYKKLKRLSIVAKISKLVITSFFSLIN